MTDLPKTERANEAPSASVEQPVRTGTFAALYNYPAFRLLWGSALGTSVAQWMQLVVLGWVALELTNSAFYVGLVSFMGGLPFIVVAIPAGMFIDRVDRRTLLMTIQASSATAAVIMAVIILSGLIQPWYLLIAAFLNGSFQSILNPTQQALIPTLVPRKDVTNAIGLMSASQNMTRIFGPSLAGALIGLWSAGGAFLLQATALVIAFFFASRIDIPKRVATTVLRGWRGIISGLTIVGSRPDLRGLFLLVGIPALFVLPYIQFLNVFARDILEVGATGLGILMASSGFGAMVGSLLVARQPLGETVGRQQVVTGLGYAVCVILVAVSRSVWLTVPLLILTGIVSSLFLARNNAIIQNRIDDDIRGRVMATYMITHGLLPLGALPMGMVAEAVSTPFAIIGSVSLSILLTLVLVHRSSALRQL